MENKNQGLVRNTGKHYLTEYAPQQVMRSLSEIKTIQDIFKAKTPTLARIKKECGEQLAIDYLALWILNLNDILNLKTKMEEFQIEYTARLVMNENPLLCVADIKIVFDSAVSGQYGVIYRLDSVTICTWFRMHWNKRLEIAENESHIEHETRKKLYNEQPREEPEWVRKISGIGINKSIHRP